MSVLALDAEQRLWLVRCYLWETPVVGGLAMLLLPVNWLREIERAWRDGAADDPARRGLVVARLVGFPARVAHTSCVASVIAYALGAVQMRLFAALPASEIGKVVGLGFLSAAVLAMPNYVIAQQALAPVLRACAADSRRRLPRSLAQKVSTCSAALVVITVSLLAPFLASQAEQMLEHQLGERLRLVAMIVRPSKVEWLRRADFWDQVRLFGDNYQRIQVYAVSAAGETIGGAPEPRALDAEDLRPETVRQVLAPGSGYVVDRNRKVRIVAFDDVEAGGKVIVVAERQDFALALHRIAWIAALIGAIGLAVASAQSRWLGRLAEGAERAEAQAHASAQALTELNAELAAARAAAVQASHAKSDFLASMSHEIRNPLNGVFGLIEFALDSDDAEERREVLLRARACASTLTNIIQDVLDLSKIEAGKVELEQIEFDPREVIEGVLDTLAVQAARKGIDLAGVVEPSVPMRLHGDAGRLRQVVLNLSSNAVKFTEEGGVVVRLGVAFEDGDGGVVVECAVTDTGIGIPHDRQEVIFDPFAQAEASTNRRFGGTGLGLVICRRIVTLMDGAIGVTSVPGEGSTFRFTARFARGVQDAPSETAPLVAGLRVAVAGRESIVRGALVERLAARGCLVTIATDGARIVEALERAARAGVAPDVLVADLPAVEVESVAACLRAAGAPALREVAIVALVSVTVGMHDRLASVLACGVVAKPIRRDRLEAALHDAMAGRRAASPARAGDAGGAST